jgi:mevalonate kinase
VLNRELETPLASATAPGKAILLGEHAVVYGYPAIAVPVVAVEARATVWPAAGPFEIRSRLPAGDETTDVVVTVGVSPDEDPLLTAARAAAERAGLNPDRLPEWLVELASTVPMGAGLGSSAAVAVAIVRAVSAAAGAELDDYEVAELAFLAEQRTHGTPSGIDNTVVAYQRPVRFSAGVAEPLAVAQPFTLLVADSGEQGPTAEMVAAVRSRRQQRPQTYRVWFEQVAGLVEKASTAMARGELAPLGWAMNTNHLILQALRVSTPRLDALVAAARVAGALGAKLSGAGGGGIVVALVDQDSVDAVAEAMLASGATRVIRTLVEAAE